ncbi:MAG TPA: hypothetical protein VLK84_26410, partial [Longimicrobium sp.]|nr:hypothetical protein [Longimicrobium sp.]
GAATHNAGSGEFASQSGPRVSQVTPHLHPRRLFPTFRKSFRICNILQRPLQARGMAQPVLYGTS